VRGEAIPSIPTLERLLRVCGQGLVADMKPADESASDRPSSLRACHGPQARLLRRKRRDLLELARRRGARNLRVFGSVARGEETPASDIDLILELGEDATLLDLARLRREIGELLAAPVDVVTPDMLKASILSRAEREAVPL